MPIFVRDAGVWKEPEPWVRDGGVWKPVDTGFVRDAGVWKEFFTSLLPPPAIGEPYEGGIYFGNMSYGGADWAMIAAPPELGITSLAWKTTNTDTPGAGSMTDGWANTNAMNNPQHPAASWCRSLLINGKDDWYLPAYDEIFKLLIAKVHNFGGIVEVWSSTQASSAQAWLMEWDGFSPYPLSANKTFGITTWAIRRVPLVT